MDTGDRGPGVQHYSQACFLLRKPGISSRHLVLWLVCAFTFFYLSLLITTASASPLVLPFSLLRHRPCSQKFVCFAKKSANRQPFLVRTIFLTYSGTPPYGHFGNTVTSLLGPLFLAARQNDHSFSLKKKKNPRQYGHLVNTAKCFWPIGDRINRVPYQNFRNRQLLPNFKGRQFFVRQENPLFIDICPSSGHPPKKTSFN